MTVLAEVQLMSPATPWGDIGLLLEGGTAQVGLVRLCFDALDDALGITLLDGAGLPERIDGVATYEVPAPDEAPEAPGPSEAPERPAHPLGAVRVDHVVVGTPDLARTVAAFEHALHVPVRRVRTEPTGSGARLHQAFFRLGEVILEIVGPPELDEARRAEPAVLRGLVLAVADIDDACDRLGPDRISAPKPAVQRGKRIATVRREVGLGWPVALLSA